MTSVGTVVGNCDVIEAFSEARSDVMSETTEEMRFGCCVDN